MLSVLTSASLAQSSSDGELAQRLKFEIWQRGLPECGAHGCSANSATDLSALQRRWMYTRSMPVAVLRGGSDGCAGTACEPEAVDLDQLWASMAQGVVPGTGRAGHLQRDAPLRSSTAPHWAQNRA